ncbi:MAG: molecular chaperone DnaK, partial [Kofleriaceae bacterium]|nr:molecular chaperone DnaK [Kofleriaceae bacterium]
CVAAKGLDEGSRVTLERDFVLLTNRPVRFTLFSSTSRDDAPGAIVPVGDGRPETIDDGDTDLLELPPLVTVLRARGRKEVTVRIEVHVTELGALELHCLDRDPPDPARPERWRLAFDMRSGGAAPTDDDAGDAQPHPRTDEAKARTIAAFRGAGNELAALAKDLEALLEARRDEWSMLTSRALFDAMGDVADTRRRSADHEQRWLNLAGFCLRPGTGAPLDAWRIKQMWGVFNEGVAFPKTEASRLAWWIAWRRIAGGMSKGQQEQIYDRLAVMLLPNPKQQKKLAEVKASKQELGEMWRALASLERLPVGHKLKIGDELMRRLASKKGRDESVHVWAIGRIAARAPLYGPLNLVVPASRVGDWLRTLLDYDWPEPEKAAFPLAQMGRRTGDRARDLDDGLRARLAAVLRTMPGGDRTAVLVEQVVALEAREERVALGDTLPAGLRLAPEPDGDGGAADDGDGSSRPA